MKDKNLAYQQSAGFCVLREPDPAKPFVSSVGVTLDGTAKGLKGHHQHIDVIA